MDFIEPSLAERFQLIVLGLCMVSTFSLIAKRLGFFKFSFKEQKRTLSFFHLLGSFSIWVLIQTILVPLLFLGFFYFFIFSGNQSLKEISEGFSQEVKSWMTISSVWGAALGVLAYLKWKKKDVQMTVWGNQGFQASFSNNLHNYCLGASTWLLGFPWVVVVGQLAGLVISYLGIQGLRGEQIAVQQLKLTAHSIPLLAGMAITVIGVVPFLEELFFRGFLQTWLSKKLPIKLAIPLASLLFALAHFSKDQGVDNLELIPSLFVLSCFLGFLYERQQSLWASIGLHSTFNFISTFMIVWGNNQ